MNKKITHVLMAATLALSVTTAVLVPTITSVYAAAPAAPGPAVTAPAATAPSETPSTNKVQTQPPAPEPPKEGANPHSGHH